jgi:hypothetical protein
MAILASLWVRGRSVLPAPGGRATCLLTILRAAGEVWLWCHWYRKLILTPYGGVDGLGAFRHTPGAKNSGRLHSLAALSPEP